jgi:hypothetical protein
MGLWDRRGYFDSGRFGIVGILPAWKAGKKGIMDIDLLDF